MGRPSYPRERERKDKRRRRKRSVLSACMLFITDKLYRDTEKHYAKHDLNLENLPESAFRHFFRLHSYQDFCRLSEALRMPAEIRCGNRTCVTGDFALAVVLRRLAFPCRWGDCIDFLGRDPSQLSRIFNCTIDLLHDKHGYLLRSLSQPWLNTATVERYAEAVYLATGRYGSCKFGPGLPVSGFPVSEAHFWVPENCFAFIDGTARAICRPGLLQREFYSGHCRGHVIKFQSIVTPDGLIINMDGPYEGRRHDMYMLGKSRLRRRLRLKNIEWGKDYCLFGDKGYSLSEEIQVPYKGNLTAEQTKFNLDMSKVRVAVELGFQRIATQFAYGNYRESQKIFWTQSAKAYLVSALLANCITCLYGFPLVQNIFSTRAPALETYLRYVAPGNPEPGLPEIV